MGEEILGGVSSDDVEAARLNLARILDMGMMESGQAVQRMKRAERQGYNREAGAMTRRVIAVDSSGYVATSLPEPGTGQTFAARPDSVRVICLSSGASERLLRSAALCCAAWAPRYKKMWPATAGEAAQGRSSFMTAKERAQKRLQLGPSDEA